MGNLPFRFRRPKISFTSEDEQAVHSIPELIDFNAKHNPDFTFCIQAEKATLGDSPGFLVVTHALLKQAIRCCTQWLTSSVRQLALPEITAHGVCKGSPVALLLDSDINLLVHVFSLISLGVPVLLLSARLSAAAVRQLLDETSARVLIHSARMAHKAKEIPLGPNDKNDGQVRLYAANDHRIWFDPANRGLCIDQSICQPGYDGGDGDMDVLILHSSGTTGLPKPIHTSHKHMLSFVTCHAFDSDESAQGMNLSTLPLYHAYGLVSPALSLGIGKSFCIPISSVNPTAASVLRLLETTHARCLMTVPSILEDIVHLHDATAVELLANLDFVAFGGSNMKPAVGYGLTSAGVRLLNHFGATECGPLAPIFIPGTDYEWQYFRLRRDIELRVEPASTSNGETYFKLITYPFGWNKPFEIQDQFVTSPRNPLIDFDAVGRKDSVIVLATGEKVQPSIVESMLSEHPLVKTAIAFGDGRFQLGVITQPTSSVSSYSLDDFKAAIWPTVLQANELMDAHARIASTDAIVIVPDSTALPRSDKGSVLRMELYTMFEGEIEQIYQRLESTELSTRSHLVLDRSQDIKRQLKELIQNALPRWNVPAQDWTTSDDLFELGMDSLQAVELRRLLLPTFGSTETVPRDFVYLHPSVVEIADAIKIMHFKPEPSQQEDGRQRMVDGFIEQYSLRKEQVELTERPLTTIEKIEAKSSHVILLTGSTGSLGCHVVAYLANLPTVREIICLVRPRTGRGQGPANSQDEALRDRLLHLSSELRSKITAIEAKLNLPRLGLTPETYNSLLGRVTYVLHNAWPMNFNWRLSSFRSQFQAVQNLLRFAVDACGCDEGSPGVVIQSRPRFMFVSSIAVVGEYPDFRGSTSPMPEISVKDVRYTNRIGYAEAKLVCEGIVERARNDFALEATSVRIGQMSGSEQSGYWNTDEHIAALVKSSLAVNGLPALKGTLSWVPVDVAASSISEILLSETSRLPNNEERDHRSEQRVLFPIYHLESSVRWPWDDVLRVLAALLAQKGAPEREHGEATLPLVQYSIWLDRVIHFGGVSTTTADETPNGGLEQQEPRLKNGIPNHVPLGNDTSQSTVANDKTQPSSSSEITLPAARLPSLTGEKKTAGNDSNTSKTNPVYSLAEFFERDFRRMACGDVVLDTKHTLAAAQSLRHWETRARESEVWERVVDGYIKYWRSCAWT